MNFKSIAVFALVALLAAPSFAQDDEKKKKKGEKNAKGRAGAAAQLLKKLEPAGLTEQQVAKIKEMSAKIQKEVKAAREAAGITQEIQKKLAAAQKSARDSKLKGKERMAAVYKEAGISEEQVAALKKANEMRQKLTKEVMAILTPEQKEKLPAAKRGQRKGGAKGKKKDAA